MPDPISVVEKATGRTISVTPEQAAELVSRGGFTVESSDAAASRLAADARSEAYGGAAGTVLAGGAAIARGFTGGGSDVLLSAAGLGDDVRALREEHELASLGGEILGGAVGVGKLGVGLGAKLAGRGGGALQQVGRAGVAGAVEGGFVGAGQGVSELALSNDPLTLERVASVMSSNVLLGSATGGVIGAGGKIVEKGLVRAKAALDDAAQAGAGKLGSAGVADDLAALDRKGLRAAEKAELDAIEAARVPKRAEVADEIKAFRKEMKEQKVWLATKGVDDAELKAAGIGKRTLDADRAMDKLLRDPKALAEDPRAALKQLRVQESALDELVNVHGPRLRETVFAADTSGARAAALDVAQVALEKNRSLQAKLTELAAKPASKKLDDIAAAVDALSAPKATPSLAQDLLGGSVFGHVAGAFSGLPIVGPMIGAKAAKLASNLVGGKLGSATAEVAGRASKAVQMFLDVGRKASPAAVPLATRTLNAVVFAPQEKKEPTSKSSLASAFKARSAEIRDHVEIGPTGGLQMRRASREQVADRLAPIAAVNPVLADAIESTKARAVEFLASKLPKRPDVGGIPVGPDTWQPSDMEMRTWARYVAAVEDPHGVVERLASASITPEDVEAITTVYPELHADIAQQVLSQLPTLRSQLPYERRLALSMFTGIPVDPALDPRVLRILQGSFAAEEGTEGGTQAPRPSPQFGSVTKPEPTAAQQRGG